PAACWCAATRGPREEPNGSSPRATRTTTTCATWSRRPDFPRRDADDPRRLQPGSAARRARRVRRRRPAGRGRAGRSRLLERRERWEHLFPRIQWTGFLVGLPGAVFFAWASGRTDEFALYGLAVNTVTSLFLSVAFVVTLLRALRRFPALVDVLGPAGRMTASNYIGQSVLIALVFTGYGLGLAGRLTPPVVMVVALVIYVVLLGLSSWWMRSHRHGPIEYGLRAVTLGTRGSVGRPG
ncbi:DUF418 domain-containing protein, partial [Streptosporangium algeriense]